VWNPWTEKADKMGDFGEDGHRGMVCVESGNVMENVVVLAPGEMHKLVTVYSVEKL
jgi:glucose-6-phosphate 1-epimerase